VKKHQGTRGKKMLKKDMNMKHGRKRKKGGSGGKRCFQPENQVDFSRGCCQTETTCRRKDRERKKKLVAPKA